MPTTVTMPQLGESIHEGTIERWLKQPGDTVEEFDALLEVMTDKVSVEVPAPASGTLVDLLVREGETVASGTPICTIEEVPVGATAASVPAQPDGVPRYGRDAAPPDRQIGQPPATAEQPRSTERETGEQHRYSPAVRALAAEHDLDLTRVSGTGIGGRISKQDVLNFLERGKVGSSAPSPEQTPARVQTPAAPAPAVQPVQSPPPAAAAAPAPSRVVGAAAGAGASTRPPALAPTPPPQDGRDERVPLSTMRRMIAEHMTASKQQVPHAWQAAEVDMSRVVAYRNRWRDEFRKREGISLSFLPFVIKATTTCLRENPAVNASFDGDAIIRHRHVNIGVAVGLEEGLVVPVLRDADGLSLAGLARGVAELAERARTRKLRPDDMQGGTFTVNNPGTFGSTLSYSIINAPQAGILTMEAVVDRVVVVDGMIAIRPIMFLCFSFDHRAIDGLQAARFLQAVRKQLEQLDVESTPLY